MLRGLTLRLAFVISFVAPGVMAGSVSFRFSQVDQFAGRYVLLRDQSEDLKQAIDRATSTMNFILRPIARRQLRQRAVLYPSLAMGRAGESFKTNLADKQILSLPLSGLPVLWKAPFGEMVRAHLRLGPELVEIFEAKHGRCENFLRLSPDRRVLTIHVRMISDELPRPVEYRLVYRKV